MAHRGGGRRARGRAAIEQAIDQQEPKTAMLIRWRGRDLQVHQWLPPEPRGQVLIVHGMAEHGARYAAFAERLVGAGFAAYAPDLPGHGATLAAGQVRGHFADRNGWRFALESIEAVKERLRQQDPQLPLFLFGHSMGSFLVQHAMRDYSRELAGVVLSATSGSLGWLRPLGLSLIRAEIALCGPRHPSALGEALTFKTFNRRFVPARTAFDWLSRDAASVDRYLADPACGFRVTAALWADLLANCASLESPRRLRPIDPNLPVLLLGGSADPVSRGARGPQGLARAYRRAGLADVQLRIYPGARHELLHETNRAEVMRDLLHWLQAHLCGRGAAETTTRGL